MAQGEVKNEEDTTRQRMEHWLTLAPAPLTNPNLRGDDHTGPLHRLTYVGEDGVTIDLFLGIQKRGAKYLLNGQFGMTAELTDFFKETAVEIWQKKRLAATATIDDFGAFICDLEENDPLSIRIRSHSDFVIIGDLTVSF